MAPGAGNKIDKNGLEHFAPNYFLEGPINLISNFINSLAKAPVIVAKDIYKIITDPVGVWDNNKKIFQAIRSDYQLNVWNPLHKLPSYDAKRIENIKNRMLCTTSGPSILVHAQDHNVKFIFDHTLPSYGTMGYVQSQPAREVYLNPNRKNKYLAGVIAHEITHDHQKGLLGEIFSQVHHLSPRASLLLNRYMEADARVREEIFVREFSEKTGDKKVLQEFYRSNGINEIPAKHANMTESFSYWTDVMAKNNAHYDRDQISFLNSKIENKRGTFYSEKESEMVLLTTMRKIDVYKTANGEEMHYLQSIPDKDFLDGHGTHFSPHINEELKKTENSYQKVYLEKKIIPSAKYQKEHSISSNTTAPSTEKTIALKKESTSKFIQAADKNKATIKRIKSAAEKAPKKTVHFEEKIPASRFTGKKSSAPERENGKSGGAGHKAASATNKAFILRDVAEGRYGMALATIAQNAALDKKVVESAAELTKNVKPVSKALGGWAKKIPVIGAVVTAGYVLYEVGGDAWDGKWGKAGAALAAGSAEAAGNMVGFGVGDAARESVRGVVVMSVGEEYAPNKSALRSLIEDMGKTSGRAFSTIHPEPMSDAQKRIIEGDDTFSKKVKYHGRDVPLVEALQDPQYFREYRASIEKAAKETGTDFGPQITALDKYQELQQKRIDDAYTKALHAPLVASSTYVQKPYVDPKTAPQGWRP